MDKWPYNTYKQSVTWWKKSGLDKFGSLIFDIPTCIVCRWEQKKELFINTFGEETKSGLTSSYTPKFAFA